MDLTALPLGSMGATGILAVVVLLIIRGALIPKSTHDARMADKDDLIKFYRLAYHRETEASGELRLQNGMLMEVAKTADHVLSSFPVVTSRTDGGDNDLAES